MTRYTSRTSTLSPTIGDQEGQKRQFDIDINTDDGYTLSAFGDISISDGFFILTSTSLVDVDVGSSRRRIRARRPPMPRKFSSRSVSDYEETAREYPRFPFPELPTPTSPYSAEADFEALFQSLKSHQASYTAPSHDLAARSLAGKPTLRVETSGLSDRRIPLRGFSRASNSGASPSLGALPRQTPGMALSASPIHRATK